MDIKLNSAQAQAVKHKSGPLLVVAGAGTGKTRVITERIKNLIEKEEVNAQNILALTFTDKASEEMANRVSDAMPLGYEEPWIYTFHAFADRILKAEAIEMGLDPAYKILSGPDQWILLRQHLFDLDLDYFRPLGNPTRFISAILKFISRLQDENILPPEVENFATSNFAEKAEQQRWQELAHVYKTYQELKIKNSYMDFGDLITNLLSLFETRPNILKKYQTQFQHILVDEFQDTNYAQYLLVKKLFEPDTKQSLLVVGDDSQSIYKFRGAAVSNILEFKEDYPKTEMVTLLDNYRSLQSILDPAYKLITNNNPDTLESKLGISKELKAAGEAKASFKPKILQTSTLEDEVSFVVSKIKEILSTQPELNYKDIAILARANNHLEPFVLALRHENLPYQLIGNRGLYSRDEIADLIAFLKALIDPNDSINLYRALNIRSLNIPYEKIGTALSQARYRKTDLFEVLKTTKDTEITGFMQKFTELQEQMHKLTPVIFLFELVKSINYLDMYVKEESVENQLSTKNLDLFANIAKKYESEYHSQNNKEPTVFEFVEYLEMLIEAGDNPAQAQIEDVDTINLLTVHASKGLEFEVVFMVNLVQNRFPTRNRSDVIEIPDELVKETLPTGDEHIQEERRLFYVGMTRARQQLYLTWAENYGGKRDAKPSGYLAETEIKTELPNITTTATGLFSTNSEYRDRPIKFSPDFLSYSQINTYETCALQYKYKYVLKVPTPPNHAFSFGNTIHNTLRDYHTALIAQKVTVDDLLKMYEKNWEPLGYLDDKHRKLRFEAGKKLLEDYYEKTKDEKIKHVGFEKSFNLNIDGIRFYGKIDRIDKLDDGVEIIDYKTGTTKEQKDIDKDDQVTFYAIGAKEALGLEPKKLTYYFLESGEKLSTTRTPEDLAKKKEEVKEVVQEIKSGNFEPTPGMHCQWCDFNQICPYAYKG